MSADFESSQIKLDFNLEDGKMVLEIIFGFLACFALFSRKCRKSKGKYFCYVFVKFPEKQTNSK